ncbi:DUF3703 domain-containing protein [Daejeonella oryzae]|uniref:DUF3703 domain-containing protein n=1 Tax=Daejeonella oryzae TaxID=1122943 RepID=UPI00041F03B7|nr:DUF3703 domain-containing protein [Daejeonella oryzae]
MKFNTKMPAGLKKHFNFEISQYQSNLQKRDFKSSWNYLERAHILGQSYPLEHSKVHWLMLKEGFRRKSLKEILGQFLRLLTGGFKSLINLVPIGNTGGANVAPLKVMEIPYDLKMILTKYLS